MMEIMRLLTLLAAFLVVTSDPVARFPLQFSANITLTAHLIEQESEYPPRVRHMAIAYDYPGSWRQIM
jgi:hypothetical protein